MAFEVGVQRATAAPLNGRARIRRAAWPLRNAEWTVQMGNGALAPARCTPLAQPSAGFGRGRDGVPPGNTAPRGCRWDRPSPRDVHRGSAGRTEGASLHLRVRGTLTGRAKGTVTTTTKLLGVYGTLVGVDRPSSSVRRLPNNALVLTSLGSGREEAWEDRGVAPAPPSSARRHVPIEERFWPTPATQHSANRWAAGIQHLLKDGQPMTDSVTRNLSATRAILLPRATDA